MFNLTGSSVPPSYSPFSSPESPLSPASPARATPSQQTKSKEILIFPPPVYQKKERRGAFLRFSFPFYSSLDAYSSSSLHLQVPFLSPKISPSGSSPRNPKMPHLPHIQALPPPPPNDGMHIHHSLLLH